LNYISYCKNKNKNFKDVSEYSLMHMNISTTWTCVALREPIILPKSRLSIAEEMNSVALYIFSPPEGVTGLPPTSTQNNTFHHIYRAKLLSLMVLAREGKRKVWDA
jgi:hypothetical protein